MRILEAREITLMTRVIQAAQESALLSSCWKSRRGAVVFNINPGLAAVDLLGRGYNRPPQGRFCRPAVCEKVCNLFTIHAERDAIQDAIFKGHDIRQASVLHLKVENGGMCVSDDLSCRDCSGFMWQELSARGLSLKEMILFQTPGFVAYDIEEYHKLTLQWWEGK
ncbi:hypothetical protein HY386_01615 [Candidatus Daviesbacteria bacterium]|nr:hypothetical protein [Candidatus Daviesbacteria bacterium]